MIHIAVCDDEEMSLTAHVQMLEKWSTEMSQPIKIYKCSNGDKLIENCTFAPIHIILLDIVMPLLNGIDTAKEIRKRDKTAKIIFLTSSTEFALSSYDVKAENYLIKPVSYEKLKAVLNECCIAFQTEPKNLVIKTEFAYQKIYFHNIEYIEAQNKKVYIYLKDGTVIQSLEPLYTFEDKLLGNDGFFKCHRSYIVYIPNIDYFSLSSIKTKSGREVPIARSYSKEFKEAYFADMFENK